MILRETDILVCERGTHRVVAVRRAGALRLVRRWPPSDLDRAPGLPTARASGDGPWPA